MSNPITHDTREAGYQAILPFAGNIRENVFEAVRAHHGGLTAEEAQAVVGCSLNCARSRLTELFNSGRLAVLAKRLNRAQTRRIAVYVLPAPTR